MRNGDGCSATYVGWEVWYSPATAVFTIMNIHYTFFFKKWGGGAESNY